MEVLSRRSFLKHAGIVAVSLVLPQAQIPSESVVLPRKLTTLSTEQLRVFAEQLGKVLAPMQLVISTLKDIGDFCGRECVDGLRLDLVDGVKE